MASCIASIRTCPALTAQVPFRPARSTSRARAATPVLSAARRSPAGPSDFSASASSKPAGSDRFRLKAVENAQEGALEAPDHPITISETALAHVIKLREESDGDNLCLRIGVKQGGCSGLSYHMDFEDESNVSADDMVMEYGEDRFKLVCDPKSLLYLFGMRLDYSHELIGGGFQFQNPNAENSCGCGKSFAA